MHGISPRIAGRGDDGAWQKWRVFLAQHGRRSEADHEMRGICLAHGRQVNPAALVSVIATMSLFNMLHAISPAGTH